MQIVGYESTPDAALAVASDGVVERIPLEAGKELSFGLRRRHCAGTVEAGRHGSCDVPKAPWCADHAETWICAKCRGTCLKDEMDCHDPHVVYLAIVAPDAVKVGVTRAARVERRLHEQGADRGAVIHEVENGRIAREIEADIARSLPERISTRQKINGLGRSVDEDAWERLLAEYQPIERYAPEFAVSVDMQPIPETLAAGEVVGTKGRLMLTHQDGSTYVTDLRDLVGYRIADGAADPERQAGLAAFG